MTKIIRRLKPSRVQKPPPTIKPTQVILHSATNNYDTNSHLAWQYNNPDNLESTFYVAGNGDTYQIMEEWWRAQANYSANGPRADGSGAISVETGSSIAATEPWQPAQVDTLVKLILELTERHGIPRRVTRSSTDPGIGYHTLWGAPGAWTPVAKTCPGPARIIQFHTVIMPAVINGGNEVANRPIYNVLRTGEVDWLIGDNSIIQVETPQAYSYYFDYLKVIDTPHGQAPQCPMDVIEWYAKKVRAWGGVCDVPK